MKKSCRTSNWARAKISYYTMCKCTSGVRRRYCPPMTIRYTPLIRNFFIREGITCTWEKNVHAQSICFVHDRTDIFYLISRALLLLRHSVKWNICAWSPVCASKSSELWTRYSQIRTVYLMPIVAKSYKLRWTPTSRQSLASRFEL